MSEQTPKQFQTPEEWDLRRSMNRTPHRDRAEKAEAEVVALTARCEALEQEKAKVERQCEYDMARLITMEGDLLTQRDELRDRCEALTAERDRLLAAQQADQERFDRDLQNYSSGYTQALDDALKGKP